MQTTHGNLALKTDILIRDLETVVLGALNAVQMQTTLGSHVQIKGNVTCKSLAISNPAGGDRPQGSK